MKCSFLGWGHSQNPERLVDFMMHSLYMNFNNTALPTNRSMSCLHSLERNANICV